jgi:hypothetical protein
MISPAKCLEYAADCFRMARRADSRKQKDILFDMGRTWETMAKHAAKLASAKPETVPPAHALDPQSSLTRRSETSSSP